MIRPTNTLLRTKSDPSSSSCDPFQPNTKGQNSPLSHVRSYLLTSHNATPRSPDLEAHGLKSRSPQLSSSESSSSSSRLTVPLFPRNPSLSHRSTPPARSTSPTQSHRHPLSSSRTPATSHQLDLNGFTVPRPILRLICIFLALATGALLISKSSASSQIRLLRSSGARPDLNYSGDSSHYGQPLEPHNEYRKSKLSHLSVSSELKLIKIVPHSARTGSAFASHPIPSSHEFLALQSYLLQSDHNSIPPHIDTSKPLDANHILGLSPSKLGRPGSAAESKWLDELDKELEEDIVIWAPAGSDLEVEGIYVLLEKLHGNNHSPVIIELGGRTDRVRIEEILGRLGIKMEKPLVIIGNKQIVGGLEELKEMYEAQTLDSELERIGWLDEWRARQSRDEAGKRLMDIKAPVEMKGEDVGERAWE